MFFISHHSLMLRCCFENKVYKIQRLKSRRGKGFKIHFFASFPRTAYYITPQISYFSGRKSNRYKKIYHPDFYPVASESVKTQTNISMINQQLINPRSIVVIGGSNDITKPGGKVLKNLIDGGFKGDLYVTNLKESEVQGIRSFPDPAKLPQVDLAIIAIAARFVPDTVKILAHQKETRAFIVLSAGFSEESAEGAQLEKEMVETINHVDGSLIGPNCVGILTPAHHSIFTYPIPKLETQGCDFISGSGATACFIMEAGIPKGLTFANVFSVGNSAQMGVEEILKYLDETFDAEKSSRVKLLYIETINKPRMLLKHASSLIRKGCRIAAIKAGSSDAAAVPLHRIPGHWPVPMRQYLRCSARRALCAATDVKSSSVWLLCLCILN
jgi:predicted CoA-binding protein